MATIFWELCLAVRQGKRVDNQADGVAEISLQDFKFLLLREERGSSRSDSRTPFLFSAVLGVERGGRRRRNSSSSRKPCIIHQEEE
jgi:hypothetical protein